MTELNAWTTLVRCQAADVHAAVFLPKDWRHGPIVTALIPECVTERDLLGPGNTLAVVSRPQRPLNWLRSVCEEVRHEHAAVLFVCDTPEQVEDAVKAAAPLLPSHERIALERVCTKTCVRASLS